MGRDGLVFKIMEPNWDSIAMLPEGTPWSSRMFPAVVHRVAIPKTVYT